MILSKCLHDIIKNFRLVSVGQLWQMLQNFRLGKSISQLIWHKVEDENPASSWSSAPLRLVVQFNIRNSLVLNLLPHSYFPPSCETLSHSSQLPSISFFLPSSPAPSSLSPSIQNVSLWLWVKQMVQSLRYSWEYVIWTTSKLSIHSALLVDMRQNICRYTYIGYV